MDVSPQQMEPNVGMATRETAYGSTLSMSTGKADLVRIFRELRPVYEELMGNHFTEPELDKMTMEEALK